MTGPDANLTKKYRGLLRVKNNREQHITENHIFMACLDAHLYEIVTVV
jgi:hypothetical protein